MAVEKVSFENSKGEKLAGVLHLPQEKTGKIIVMAHGFTSNKDRPKSIEVATLLAENGFTALRFDFGGSGESYDTPIRIEYQVDDLKSAINFIKNKGYDKLGLIGGSLGGLISLSVYNEDVKAMVLFAPVTKGKTPSEYAEWKKSIEEKGFVLKEKDGRVFNISRDYIKERESINQEELLSKVKCPVLIIHGTEDDDVPLEDSKDAMKYLPKGSKLEIIEGVGHKLDIVDGIDILSLNWFKEYLK
ncbi:MAG: alpha/beta fold hydrolase [Nanoarchaeota archaeon]|nr:alpha/beta fold hydrolase [Nanoarchaeota archaeon]